VISEAEFAEILNANTYSPDVKLSFKRGDVLYWDTGASSGTMKVLSVNGGKFTVEQNNEKNVKAKDVRMSGEIFDDGTCRIDNPEWKEVWLGNINGNTLVGKVNNMYDFRITWGIPKYMSHTVGEVSKLPFSKGDIIKWSAGSGRGTMKVTSLVGDNFVVDKFNDFDKKKTPVRMRGTLSKNGNCVLKNDAGTEVWNGRLSGNVISGKNNKGYNFKITRSNFVLDMPFKTGGVLTWNANYRKGTIKVVSVSSVGKFVFDMYPSYSTRLKETSLEGEILADGTYKMINTKTNEIWIGRRNASEVVGMINNKSKFVIDGLQ